MPVRDHTARFVATLRLRIPLSLFYHTCQPPPAHPPYLSLRHGCRTLPVLSSTSTHPLTHHSLRPLLAHPLALALTKRRNCPPVYISANHPVPSAYTISPPCIPIVNHRRPYFLAPPPAFLIAFGRQGHAGQWPSALPLAADGLAKRSPNHAPTSSPNPALCSGFPMACGFALARCAVLLPFTLHQRFKHKHRLVPRRASSAPS